VCYRQDDEVVRCRLNDGLCVNGCNLNADGGGTGECLLKGGMLQTEPYGQDQMEVGI
jgi:hypothetical protein